MNRAQRRAEARAPTRPMTPRDRRLISRTWARERAALDAQTLDDGQIADLSLFGLIALQTITSGQAGEAELADIAVMSNIARLLAERGYGAEAVDDIAAGQQAALAMRQRWERTGRVGLAGPELQALRTLMQIHEQQLALGPTAAELRSVIGEMRAANSVLQRAAAEGAAA
jgi:hypothetical protein